MTSNKAVLTSNAGTSGAVLDTRRSFTEFRGSKLYNILKGCILSEQQLRDNEFPRPHPDGEKGHAMMYIKPWNKVPLPESPNERFCDRCGKKFAINAEGFPLLPENCRYHSGKKYRSNGTYSCCNQRKKNYTCCTARMHVFRDYIDDQNLRGYVKTLPKDVPAEEQGIFALDCEMSYTTQGLQLTRVTVVDEDCNVAYQTLVRPQDPITDYNTRFSGVTAESMKGVTTTLLDVQKTLLAMFSEKTILVGHALDNDLRALQLLHDTVIDTSVIFPHPKGNQYKRALRTLCSEYLGKTIQNDVSGHDSKEDAVSCMQLILWKAKRLRPF